MQKEIITKTKTLIRTGICRLAKIGAVTNNPLNRANMNKNVSQAKGIYFPLAYKLKYNGRLRNKSSVKVVSILIIQGPKIITIKNTITIFGTNTKVISWSWVVAWKILMVRPVSKAAPRIGADINKTVYTA
jgi:hypothetical protein